MSSRLSGKTFGLLAREAVAATVAEALNRALAGRDARAKRVAAAIGSSVDTGENLLSGHHAPSAPHLIALMAEYPEVTEAVLEMAGRNNAGDQARIARAIALLEGRE